MEWPARFYAIREGRGCPMCEGGRPDETPYGIRFFAGEHTDAYLQRVAIQRGYAIVVWRGRHVAEPTQLSEEELGWYLSELMHVARGMEAHLKPVKLNYEIFGNAVPHLHTHIIPRYAIDPKPSWPFPFPNQDPPEFPDAELRAEAAALRALLSS